MIIEIQYKDKNTSWQSNVNMPISGKVTSWEYYSKKYKDERVQPHYVAPITFKNTWNGQEHDAQHVLHECYYFQFQIKESEIHDIQRMKSVSDIRIYQHNQDENGIYNLDVVYYVDTLVAENFMLIEPERVDQTSAWKIGVIFKTNRTIVNKIAAENQNNYIELSVGNFYSNFEIVQIYEEKPSITYPWSFDEEYVLMAYHRAGYEILLYFNDEELNYFLTYLKYSPTRRIKGWAVQEYSYTQTAIGIGLHAVVVRCITSISQFPKVNTFSKYYLTINSVAYYTDLLPTLIDGDSQVESVDNQTGVKEAIYAVSKVGKKITFFNTEVNILALKRAWELSIEQTVTLYDGTTTATVLERVPVSPERLGKDLFKLEINCITNSQTT